MNDNKIREIVAENGNDGRHFSITYACLEGTGLEVFVFGALSNDFGIVTAHQDGLIVYLFPKLSTKSIKHKFAVMYNSITKLKIGKFLMWNNIEICFVHENKVHKIKLKISNLAVGIKGQKEEAQKLVAFLKQLKTDRNL